MTLPTTFAGKSSPSTPSPLLEGLLAYWKLNEESGDRADSHGSNHLSEFGGSIGFAAGLNGNAASFDKTQLRCLKRDSHNLNKGAEDFTFSGWVKTNDENSFARWIDINLEFNLHPHLIGAPNDRMNMQCYDTALVNETAIKTGAYVTNTWYHILAWYIASTKTMHFVLNNGTDTTRIIDPDKSPATSNKVSIGGYLPLSTVSNVINGLVQHFGFWERELTPAERTYLYGSGTPPNYPFNDFTG